MKPWQPVGTGWQSDPFNPTIIQETAAAALLRLRRPWLYRRRLRLRDDRLRRLVLVRSSRADAANAASVERRAFAADRLKIQFLAHDLDQHEGVVRIVAVDGQVRLSQVALPQLRRRSDDEVGHAILRLEPLVEV